MDRATGFYPVGWGFESLRAHVSEEMAVLGSGMRRQLDAVSLFVWQPSQVRSGYSKDAVSFAQLIYAHRPMSAMAIDAPER